ncbi:threonine ammonia-lyase [Salinactinospora qingdaonensis]|uniref:threonine ammonia-lyase n=1 Tax=Salinactinospora qingdaonensis TaxID=702744 RepID=UPI0031E698FB
MELVGIAEVWAAVERVRGWAVRTPLVPCPWARGRLWVKPEGLQPVGAFKVRGVANALACREVARRGVGVVTHSSGNHGRALAYVARGLGVECVVVVPRGAPEVKVAAVRGLGARVVVVDAGRREEVAWEVAAAEGKVLVPPFDDRDVIAGQGTVGVEVVADLAEVETVLVPVGGGGLASGVATAVKALRPGVRVVGVEPELAGDAAESVREGRLVVWPVEERSRTVADGVRVGLSELTFAHVWERLDGVVTVSEEEILAAMGALVCEGRMVAEPSGAVAVAAQLAGKAPGGSTVAVVSGGNADRGVLARVVGEYGRG